MKKITGQSIYILDRGREPLKAITEDLEKYKSVGCIFFKTNETEMTEQGEMLIVNENFEESGYKIDRENIEKVEAQIVPILNEKDEFIGNILINLKTNEAADGLIYCANAKDKCSHRVGNTLTFIDEKEGNSL